MSMFDRFDVEQVWKKAMVLAGMEVDGNGRPSVRVGDVSFEGAWPVLSLDSEGEVEIEWPVDDEEWIGGYVNGQWSTTDGRRVLGVGGAWIHRGGIDDSGQRADPGDLCPYRGWENGNLSGPQFVLHEFDTDLLLALLEESLGPDAFRVLALLGEAPSTWSRERLEATLRESLGAPPEEQDETDAFDDQLEVFLEACAENLWEEIEGMSAMSNAEIWENIWGEIETRDDLSHEIRQISEHVDEHGLPDGFAAIEGYDRGDDLLYGRIGWKGDPDAPEDDEEVLQILAKVLPDKYGDVLREENELRELLGEPEREVSTSGWGERGGWFFVKTRLNS